jgi:hypothetical protein
MIREADQDGDGRIDCRCFFFPPLVSTLTWCVQTMNLFSSWCKSRPSVTITRDPLASGPVRHLIGSFVSFGVHERF